MSAIPPTVHLVASTERLTALAEHLRAAPRVAIDTEFHAEHRYRPELMLVQVATDDGEVWVIDARAVDLRGLKGVLSTVPLVVHGGGQDLALLYRATGAVPSAVFDTQRAGGLLGYGFPARLGALTQRAMGVALDKAAGLSDWSIRPLSERQLRYAAEDAAVLLPLASALQADLRGRGRLAWAESASLEVVEEAIQPSDETTSWMSWEIAPLLDDDERKALHALFQWRESIGRQQDQPPRQVLSDALALDLARRQPSNLGEMAENRRLPQGVIRRHGATLLTVLRESQHRDAPVPAGADQLLVATALEAWAGVHERETGLARALTLPRALALKAAARGAQALEGWREEAIGPALDQMLRGKGCLFVDNGVLQRHTR